MTLESSRHFFWHGYLPGRKNNLIFLPKKQQSLRKPANETGFFCGKRAKRDDAIFGKQVQNGQNEGKREEEDLPEKLVLTKSLRFSAMTLL